MGDEFFVGERVVEVARKFSGVTLKVTTVKRVGFNTVALETGRRYFLTGRSCSNRARSVRKFDKEMQALFSQEHSDLESF